MNTSFLEQFYENVILPSYGEGFDFSGIRWKDHGKVDLDAWAHYFEDKDGREYVLLYEDFPGGSFLDDGLTHEIIELDGEKSIELKFGIAKQITNITGWFTLFREKDQRS